MERRREDREQKRYPKSRVLRHLRVTLSGRSRTPFLSPSRCSVDYVKYAGVLGKDGSRKERSAKLALG